MTAGNPWTGPPLEHLQAIHAELKASLDRQLEDLNVLDTKATVLLTPIGVLLGLGIAAVGSITPSLVALWLFNLGLFLLFLALLAGVGALWLRRIAVTPIATGLWPSYATRSTEEMLADECAAIAVVYATNAEIRGRKRPWIIAQFALLVLGTVLLAAGYTLKVADILR